MIQSVQNQRGMSLIELMIAMLLGLILMAGVIEIFLSSNQMYGVQDARARLQENGRYAIQLLAENIRKAGYNGCATRAASIPITNTLNDNTNYLWDFSTGIQGFEATGANQWTPGIDDSITSPLSGGDVLTVRAADGPIIQVASHSGGTLGSADIKVNGPSGLEQDDIVIVSDCVAAAIFQITNINSAAGGDDLAHAVNAGACSGSSCPGNATTMLGKYYTVGGLMKLETTSYYVRNNADGVPSLYQRVSNSNAQELIEGVEDMQVLYGVDTDNDNAVEQYVTANNVVDWTDVMSVRVSLLLRTLMDNLTVDGGQEYTFNGSTVKAADSRLRAVFTRTITLRNRVP